jgi:hypothetical protein
MRNNSNINLHLVNGNVSFTVKIKDSTKSKKLYIRDEDIYKFAQTLNENKKVRLLTDEHTAMAYILQSLFGDDTVNIVEGYVFLVNDANLSKKLILRKCRESHKAELETRRCKLNNGIVVSKDGLCRKFLDCYIRFQGRKPDGCVAIWNEEKQLYFTNNNKQFENYSVSLDKLREIDEFAYRVVQETLNLRKKKEKVETVKKVEIERTTTERITVTITESKELSVEDVFNEILEESIDLQRLSRSDTYAFNIAKQYIINKLKKGDLSKYKRRVCPYLLLPHTCRLLVKKKKPITVHARQTYVIVPKIKTDCPLSYGLDYPKTYTECWVYQEFGRKRFTTDTASIKTAT